MIITLNKMIIIFITLIIIFNVVKYVTDEVITYYHCYRLSDVFNGYIKRNNEKYMNYLKKYKPNSIANKYVNSTKENLDYGILMDIIDKDYDYVKKHNFIFIKTH